MECSAAVANDALRILSRASNFADENLCAEQIDQHCIACQQERRLCIIFLPFIFFVSGWICGTLWPRLLPSIGSRFLAFSQTAFSWIKRTLIRLAARQKVGELPDFSVERRRSIASRRNSTKKVLPESSYGTQPGTAGYGHNIRKFSLVGESRHGLIEAQGVELRIVTADPAVCRLLGWTTAAGRALPATVHDLLPPELRDLHCRLLLQARPESPPPPTPTPRPLGQGRRVGGSRAMPDIPPSK